jgi:ankyrin repeat protein
MPLHICLKRMIGSYSPSCSFSILPIEIWHNILIYLDNYYLYCKTLTLSKNLYELSWKYIRKDWNNNYAIQWTCSRGFADRVRILLEDPSVDPTVNYDNAFIQACTNGHLECCKLLLKDRRIYPKICNLNTGIILASIKGHDNIVKFLIEDERSDPSTCNNMAIREAALYMVT